MVFLSFLPAWLTATPVNFVLVALVILYLISLLLENVRDDVATKSQVGIICGAESSCKRLAACVNGADRFELAKSPAEILKQAMRRNMVILFIVQGELTGKAEDVFKHLQSVYGESENPYSGLRFAVFGIGDTLSEDFNALAIEYDLRLRKVGAERVVPMRLFDTVTSEDGLEREFYDFVKAFSPQSMMKVPEALESSDVEATEATESGTEDETDIDDEAEQRVREALEKIEMQRIETDEAQLECTAASAENETSEIQDVEPSVDISTSVFETVDAGERTEEQGDGSVRAQLSAVNDEMEAALRSRSPKEKKSEMDEDEDWEIIKLMSNKDDSS